MTKDDYERISAVNWSEKLEKFKGKNLFRPLKPGERQDTLYTHAIKEGADGHCPFLVDNLCFIHKTSGAKFKPAICQLFPYCFNETPSGVYASVSFVSMGVVYNSGKALSEQRDLLEAKLKELQQLYPSHQANWSKLQLTVGQPIEWQDYLAMEKVLLDLIGDKSKALEDRFLSGSLYLCQKAKPQATSTQAPQQNTDTTPDSASLNRLDIALLGALHQAYFPSKTTGRGEGEFSFFNLLGQVCRSFIYPGLRFHFPNQNTKLTQLQSVKWPDGDEAIDDLLYRYFYSRLFAKLYFGAGFGQLSLIAGFHHLAVLLALVKWQAKGWAYMREAELVSFVDVVAAVRQLEKRLGETTVGPYAAASLELLLFSHQRLKRILDTATR
jgi:hypothetical protein